MKEKKELNIQIGERIRRARERAGYTQEFFAEKIDVSVQYISDLERGVTGASVSTIIKICRTLHTTADYILMGLDAEAEAETLMERIKHLTPKQRKLVEQSVDLTIEALLCR